MHATSHSIPSLPAPIHAGLSVHDLQQQYRFGDCGVFAIAVSRETGWPVVLLRAPGGMVVHAVCQVARDTYFDAAGHTDVSALRQCYGHDVQIDNDCDEDDLAFIFAPDEAEIDKAREVYFQLLLTTPSAS